MKKYHLNKVFKYEGIALGLFLSSLIVSIIEVYRHYSDGSSVFQFEAAVLPPIFLAAWVTLKGLAEQVRLVQQLEDEKYERERRAAKSRLPLATARMSTLTAEMVKWHMTSSMALPNISEFSDAARELESSIKYLDKESAERVLQIFRVFQVLWSRSEGLRASERDIAVANPRDKAHYEHWSSTVSWAVLGAMTEQLFEYARTDAEKLPSQKVNRRVWSRFFRYGLQHDTESVLHSILSIRSNDDRFEMSFDEAEIVQW